MMELEVGGQRTSIPVGEMVIGTDPSCGLRLDRKSTRLNSSH